MALIPMMWSKGTYLLLDPFQQLLQPNVEYTCESILGFAEIIESGEDPYAAYYEPRGIEQAKYEQDVLEKAVILRLRSSQNQWVSVPSTYVIGVPNPNGIPYQAMLLGISLGAIPVDLALDSLKASITAVVKDYLGVDSEVEEVIVSDITAVELGDHEAFEAARLGNITMNESDRSKAVRLETTMSAMREKILELETYIANNYVR